MATLAAGPGESAELFGHPRGLTVLATTEMWERFSFYGMQALLMLYMTKYLLLPEHARGVIGLASYRAGLEAVVGKLDDVAFAGQTYGIYSGMIYLTPIIGAWLGDRVLGRTRTITIGCLIMAAGHLAMASEQLFLGALTLLVIGSGCVIGNMAAQVGLLYSPEDQRRTRGFGIYLITLNVGALIAPLIIGTLGEDYSWHWGFGAAGIGMLIGLATYLAGRRHMPPDSLTARTAASKQKVKLTRSDWHRIGVILLLLFVPYVLYFTATNQSYSIMYVWADTQVDRNILGFEMPVTWIGIFDGLATICGVWLGNRLSLALERKRGRDLGDVAKIGMGIAGVALAWLFAVAIARLPVTPLGLWLTFFMLQDFSYGALIEPPIQALVTRDSPQSVVSMMMAMYKAATAVSYFLAGWMDRFYEPLGASGFFLLTAGMTAIGAVIMFGGFRWWVHHLGPVEEKMEGVSP
ncbi:peptide MFS transporter [Tsuneonella mangrovi]|uniref:peptide MFS transporter n=1 Tax=Tsuneonella mangrovi TaxID=1982042 RepID=UPI0014716674|nr:peptide MFS transporter [Tsuneonella mangrovi]